jgi:hypothetical protein
MDDQFWADILKLTEYKKFELVGLDHVSRELKLKYPEQSYNYKSVVFKIFRRYFFNVTEYEGNMDDFGDLRICWSPDEGLDEIIRKGCEVFKLFYKLNYSLWKIEYLKQKKETIKRH